MYICTINTLRKNRLIYQEEMREQAHWVSGNLSVAANTEKVLIPALARGTDKLNVKKMKTDSQNSFQQIRSQSANPLSLLRYIYCSPKFTATRCRVACMCM